MLEHQETHHEESDIDIRGVFRFVAGLFVGSVIVFLLVWALFGYFDRREARGVPEFPLGAGRTRVPPQPRLQVAPRDDFRDLRQSQEDVLESYQWIDRDAGRVRIPIDQAIRLTLERGLPVRSETGTP
jgi:hypothetical protein